MNSKPKSILLTGGGTAGHVTPNIALIPLLQQHDWQIHYVGTKNGIEKQLISSLENVIYHKIVTGKIRRYFSWQNFFDPFKVIYGILQSLILCLKLKPNIIFSKGGFVAFPIVVAGKILRIPIICHESDLSPGLANKLSQPFANKICLTFADSVKYFNIKNQRKLVVTGTPIRQDLFNGNKDLALNLCSFDVNRKTLLVIGGSLGSSVINKTVREIVSQLIQKNWQIIHICGKGKIDESIQMPYYKQFSYVTTELAHLMALADLVISRAGANSVYELLALKKPHIFIPLSKKYSRGDQIDNALCFANKGFSQVILEEELNNTILLNKVNFIQENYVKITQLLDQLQLPNSNELIIDLIEQEKK